MIFAPVAHAPGGSWSWLDLSQSVSGAELRGSLHEALERPDPPRVEQIIQLLTDALRKGTEESGIMLRPDTFSRAFELLTALPEEFPLPTVVVESEREIGFDWDEGARRVLAVTVDDSSFAGYSALLGAEPVYGRVPFARETPQTLSYLLARIYSESR